MCVCGSSGGSSSISRTALVKISSSTTTGASSGKFAAFLHFLLVNGPIEDIVGLVIECSEENAEMIAENALLNDKKTNRNICLRYM